MRLRLCKLSMLNWSYGSDLSLDWNLLPRVVMNLYWRMPWLIFFFLNPRKNSKLVSHLFFQNLTATSIGQAQSGYCTLTSSGHSRERKSWEHWLLFLPLSCYETIKKIIIMTIKLISWMTLMPRQPGWLTARTGCEEGEESPDRRLVQGPGASCRVNQAQWILIKGDFKQKNASLQMFLLCYISASIV